MPAAPANAFRCVTAQADAPCRTGAAAHAACPRTPVRLHSGGDCGCVRSPPFLIQRTAAAPYDGATQREPGVVSPHEPVALPARKRRLASRRTAAAPGTCRHSRMASPVLGATLSISIAGRYAGRRCDRGRRMGRKLLRSGERPRARGAERPGGDRARPVMNARPWRERIASWTTSPRAGRPPLLSMT